MALLDLLGRRWSLRVLWELYEEDARTFRALQLRCGNVSSSVLSERLRELREAAIVTSQSGEGYRLTPEGRRLMLSLAPLDEWARQWARQSSDR